ncbi:cell division protein FtsQ/DivIB [Luteococcus sp. OSA5]|uniref:cell division protein FtsQ/DivIB n=1 Tax=Luteococcus sp. OSA5 TaxID=3401630 RepID=UPI003B437F3A
MTPSSRLERGDRPRPATPTDVSAAIEQRRRLELRRRRLTVALAAALVALALTLVWVVRHSPVLSVRQVEVTGTRQVKPDQVVSAAQVPMGTPLARLDTRAIAERVSSGIVPVGEVRVHTKLPDTVVVEVSERSAVYQRKAGAQWQSVDASGVIFAQGPRNKRVAAVETTSVDNRLLADVATVVTSLPPAVKGRVQVVRAESPDRIELALDKGQKVVWGSAAASPEKGRVLQVLLGQEATVFDVSSPATPSTR